MYPPIDSEELSLSIYIIQLASKKKNQSCTHEALDPESTKKTIIIECLLYARHRAKCSTYL